MEGINVLIEACTGCGVCIRACPYKAIEMREKKAWITEKCTLCGACVEVCPWKAIVIAGWKPLPRDDLSQFRGICVLVEHRFGKLSPVVAELIGAARELKRQLEAIPDSTETKAFGGTVPHRGGESRAGIKPRGGEASSAEINPRVGEASSAGIKPRTGEASRTVIQPRAGLPHPREFTAPSEDTHRAEIPTRHEIEPSSESPYHPVSALLLGTDVQPLVEELFSHGVDEVWLLDKPGIDPFAEDILADLSARAIRDQKPEIVLGGGTVMGRSLLPRVAARLRTGLTADCTELSIDPGTGLLRQTRPAWGGNIMATILCEGSRPQMATVRHKVMKPAPKEPGRTGRVVELDYKVPASALEILEFVEDTSQKVDLTEADFIVSGGRGLGDPKNFSYIDELARAVGGTVGASRAAVDAGWIPYPHQVGQTGKTVNPKVYIACGISGAVQHQVGMKSSDVIIAINKDPNAPIFSIAHYGIVGDLFQVIPELIRQLRKREGGT